MPLHLTWWRRCWIWMINQWCRAHGWTLVWIHTANLDRQLHLCIARPRHDPWDQDTRLRARLHDGSGWRTIILQDDGTTAERVPEEDGKSQRRIWREVRYNTRWMCVDPEKRAWYTLRNG